MFGIIVSYSVKVKLYLGALGGELIAELPFLVMHSKVSCFFFFFLLSMFITVITAHDTRADDAIVVVGCTSVVFLAKNTA